MAKAKISSKDFLDLLDEQNDQPAPAIGSFGRPPTPLSSPLPNSGTEPLKQESVKKGLATGNKVATNREQTGNISRSELATKWQQTDNEASDSKKSHLETGNKVGSELATLSATKWQQTENKLVTNLPFSSLVGLQRGIMVFLYDACKTARGRATTALTLEHIGNCLKTSSGSAKTTIQRLEDKGCIIRVEFKNGRGGWSKYELPEVLFREMLQLETENKLTTNWQQTENKVGSELATEPATSPSSSSSSLYLENFKTTTTGETELFEKTGTQLTPEWQSIDVSPLAEIGFTQTHLLQIIRQGKLEPAEVQDSIHFFAFDLARNGKGRTLSGPPLNFFMGIVRKGIPYAPPENFESPAEETRRKIREFKERKERERQDDEQRIRDLEFAEWRRGVSTNELARLLPEWAQKPGQIQDSAIRTHFDEKVWPEQEAARLGVSVSERAEIRAAVTQSLGEVNG